MTWKPNSKRRQARAAAIALAALQRIATQQSLRRAARPSCPTRRFADAAAYIAAIRREEV